MTEGRGTRALSGGPNAAPHGEDYGGARAQLPDAAHGASVEPPEEVEFGRARSRSWHALRFLLQGVALVLTAVYPLVVWRGLLAGSPRRVALVLLLILVPTVALRVVGGTSRQRAWQGVRHLSVLPFVSLAALGLAAWLDSSGFILAVPIAINTLMLSAFGSTLRRGVTPMVERFARLQVPDLDEEQRAWCRLWTRLWCAFFAVNGAVAGLLAVFAPLDWWAFYNGLLAYLLVGAMFAAEWTLRRRRFPQLTAREVRGA